MKQNKLLVAAMFLLASATVAHAQFNLKSLANKAKEAIAGDETKPAAAPAAAASAAGRTFYVSASTGSARSDGLTPSTAMKDLQKAIDTAQDNDIIQVAEG